MKDNTIKSIRVMWEEQLAVLQNQVNHANDMLLDLQKICPHKNRMQGTRCDGHERDMSQDTFWLVTTCRDCNKDWEEQIDKKRYDEF
jgi:hypothetical protein